MGTQCCVSTHITVYIPQFRIISSFKKTYLCNHLKFYQNYFRMWFPHLNSTLSCLLGLILHDLLFTYCYLSFQPHPPLMSIQWFPHHIFATTEHSFNFISESVFPSMILHMGEFWDWYYMFFSLNPVISHFNHTHWLQLLKLSNIISLKPQIIPSFLFQTLFPLAWYYTWVNPCPCPTWSSLQILLFVTSTTPTDYNYSNFPTSYLYNHKTFLHLYFRFFFL